MKLILCLENIFVFYNFSNIEQYNKEPNSQFFIKHNFILSIILPLCISMMQLIKSFKNIQRSVAHTNKLHFKYYHDRDPNKESDCAEMCLLECSQLNPFPDESDECQTLTETTETCNEKCSGYHKYSFHDFLIQTVTHIKTQPSNKEYFEPKGTLDKKAKMENQTK